MQLLLTVFCVMCIITLLGVALYTAQDVRIERRMREAERRWNEIKKNRGTR